MRCFIPLILISPPHLVNFLRVMRGSGPGPVSDPQSPLWPIGNPLWLASAHHPLTSSSSSSPLLLSLLSILSSIVVVNIIIFHHHQLWSSLWLGCLQTNQICMLTMVVIWCVMMDKVAEVDPFPTRYERVSATRLLTTKHFLCPAEKPLIIPRGGHTKMRRSLLLAFFGKQGVLEYEIPRAIKKRGA